MNEQDVHIGAGDSGGPVLIGLAPVVGDMKLPSHLPVAIEPRRHWFGVHSRATHWPFATALCSDNSDCMPERRCTILEDGWARCMQWCEDDNSDVASPVGGGGGGAYSWPFWVGSTLVFAVESSPTYRILRWTEQDGTRVLVGFLDDDSKGAGQPGSDGIDLVWTQGEDLEIGESKFPNRWVMTSKFSTDPAKIAPRRLMRWASTYTGTSGQPPAVGCGHAAFGYEHEGAVPDRGVLIVRLSDGVSWLLPSVSHARPDYWVVPLAVTCVEVFAVYRGGPYQTIRRVWLNSLGPGTAPPG